MTTPAPAEPGAVTFYPATLVGTLTLDRASKLDAVTPQRLAELHGDAPSHPVVEEHARWAARETRVAPARAVVVLRPR